MSFEPTGLRIGFLFLSYYGVILMSGVIAGASLAERQAKKKGLDSDFLWDSLFWTIIFGIIGARLWHIFTPSPSLIAQGVDTAYYLSHPLDAIAVWRGGLGIPGAVIGGIAAFYIQAKRRGEDFLPWIDAIAPALPLGQAIGRWGNFVNQELYGAPSDLPWAITISPEHRLPEFADQATYHPIFLYEGLWNAASVLLLLWLSRRFAKQLIPGDLFLVYLISYPTIRILLEFLRLDSSEVAGFNANQTFMVVVLAIAALSLFFRHRKPSN
jgi:phosphatidylglycerol:prolipoprotein diacylglycerol transferase